MGIIRVVEEKRHIGKDNARAIIFQLLKHIARTDTRRAHETLLKVCKALFDNTVYHHVLKCKVKGLTWKAWLLKNKGVASLVLPSDDIEAVMSAEDYSVVHAQVNRLALSGLTGEVLFSPLLENLAPEAFTREVKAGLKKLIDAEFDEGVLEEVKADCGQKASKVEKTCRVRKHDVVVTRLGMLSTFSVMSHMGMLDLLIQTMAKSEALGKNKVASTCPSTSA